VGLKYTPAAYVGVMKHLSLVLSVLIGGTRFNERPLLPCLGGVFLMCSGVVFIALKG
jgi:drug/metabolite transporter (DMT)-like permease